MKISVDGGSFCTPENNQFGNYTFSNSLINALSKYDKKNKYTIYTFCNFPKDIPLSKNFTSKKILPKYFWSKVRVAIEEIANKKDIYLALNQSIPMMSFSKIISFSHGLSFHFYPGLYKDFSKLNDQLEEMIDDSDKIIVSSTRVKSELIEIESNVSNKIKVIPYGIPVDMMSKEKEKANSTEKYFVHVGMDHPIKNIDFIIKAFKSLKNGKLMNGYKLYLVGCRRRINDSHIKVIPYANRTHLKKLYRGATATLTSSFYESFNLPVLESLSQGTKVVGLRQAIVPELRPYVALADDLNEFRDLMKKVDKNPGFRNTKKIKKEFSWENYVRKLVKLY